MRRLATVNTALLPLAGEKRFLPNEVLVVFRVGTSEGKIDSIARRLRLEQAQVRDLTLIGMRAHRFRFADNRSANDVLMELSRRPQVMLDVLVASPRAAYDLTTGASVACAEVSGIAALVLEEKPNLDGPALRRLLQDTAHAFAGVIADAQAAVERVH